MPFLLLIATVLAITWSINLYNFMDGADGLAGGMALFGFSAYGSLAWQQGAAEFAALNLCVAAAALGFLIFNFPPAKVFLGDAGSVPLGYLTTMLDIVGILRTLRLWWFPLLGFSPFLWLTRQQLSSGMSCVWIKGSARNTATWTLNPPPEITPGAVDSIDSLKQ